MANMADFSLKAKGSKKSLETLKEMLEYGTQDRPHFFVYDCYSAEIESDYLFAFGACKWSASACFLKGENSYYERFHKESTELKNLQDIAKELNLEIELFGNEIGCDFAEYYLINNNGEIVADEYIDGISENAIEAIVEKFELDEQEVRDFINGDLDDNKEKCEFFADLYDDDFDDIVFCDNSINNPANYAVFDNGVKYEEFTL